MNRNKKYILLLWVFIISFMWSVYFHYPEFFTEESLATFLKQFQGFVIFWYLFLFLIRWITLIPSTVLIIAWTLVFSPPTLIILASIWALWSSSLVYFAAKYLKLGKEAWKQLWKKKIDKFKKRINEHWFVYVTIWSMLPIIPTDIICAIAWASKMRYRNFALWIFLGSLPLISAYAYLWQSLFQEIL